MVDGISTKRFVAIHEAGHAVAADFYNISFIATIIGQHHVQLGEIDPEVRCVVVAAGPLAQAKYQRRSLLAVYLDSGGEDFKTLMKCDEEWATIVPGSRLEVWKQSARMIINQRWKAVHDVATQLLSSGTLTSEQVRNLVSQR